MSDRTESEFPPEMLVPFREAADPLRWRAYMVLAFLGPMKVGPLARMTGSSVAVMRRHLEAMSSVGLVREVEVEGTQLWERFIPTDPTQHAGLRVNPDDPHANAIVESAEFSAWLDVMVQVSSDLVREFIAQRMEVPEEWRNAAEIQDYVLYMRKSELEELGDELGEIVRRRRPQSRERLRSGDPEARPIYVATHAVLWPKK